MLKNKKISGKCSYIRYGSLSLGIFFSLGNVNLAQAIPGPADAGRIEEQFSHPPPALPSLTSPQMPTLPQAPPTNIPAKAEKIHFTLKQVHIEGATAYSSEKLSTIYKDKIGQDITLSDIYKIATAITELYSRDGYALSRAVVPPQQITNGIVSIAVVEGGIGEVHIQGAYHETAITRGIIDHIQSMHLLNSREFERDILLLNDLAGVTVRAVLEKMSDKYPAPGAIAVRLIFDEKPSGHIATTAAVDNYGSRYLGPGEMSLTATKNGILGPYDKLTLSGVGALPISALHNFSTQYTVPLSSNGLSIGVSGAISSAHPGYRLESQNVESRSSSVEAMLSWQAIRQRANNLTLGIGVAAKDIHSDISNAPLNDDKIRELRGSIIYSQLDPWSGSNAIDAELAQGVNALGASNISNKDSTFTKLNITANRSQDITSAFQIYTAVIGQIASKALLSSEQLGYGGQAFGRAYDTSEIIGDEGLAGALELRYNELPSFLRIKGQPFVFYDIGKVWDIESSGADQSGASAGAGLRFTSDYHILGTFTLAQPLTRDVAANSPGSGHNTRAFFSLSGQF